MKWRFLNPNRQPHEEPDTSDLMSGNIWRSEPDVCFVRWTSDFDCKEETNWWYVIKDDVYDPSRLKAKRRNVITKGRKNFSVRIINPAEYNEALSEVMLQSFTAYPAKYRPHVDIHKLKQEIVIWGGLFFGAFKHEEDGSEKLCGFSHVTLQGKCIHIPSQKTIPEYEKLQVNAALIDAVLLHFNDQLKSGEIYICDGERSVNHETCFQEYLMKYFGFRKAHCKLHVAYPPV